MLSRGAIGISLLLGLLASSTGFAHGAERAPRDTLNVWTTNIHFQTEQWKRVIARMDDGEAYKPDIVLVQEINNRDCGDDDTINDKKEFLNKLEAQFGENYVSAHSTPTDEKCWKGSNNLVAWRTARYTKTLERRWYTYRNENGTCDDVYSEHQGLQMAVRLRHERLSTDADPVLVMAASMHIKAKHDGNPSAGPCIDENLAKADRELEAMEPAGEQRDLTVIGGDFNQRPDDDGSPEESGQESDPECWYQWLSAAHEQEPCPDPHADGYGDTLDNYYDSVWVEQAGTNPSSDLCNEWTHTKGGATSGNACTDNNGDGKPDRSRIDYIWSRWETPEGPRSFDGGSDQNMFELATNDNYTVLKSWRYSDHRSVNALVRWCLPEEGC